MSTSMSALNSLYQVILSRKANPTPGSYTAQLLDKGESAMLSIRNFGDKSLTELKAAMAEKGYLEKEEEVE